MGRLGFARAPGDQEGGGGSLRNDLPQTLSRRKVSAIGTQQEDRQSHNVPPLVSQCNSLLPRWHTTHLKALITLAATAAPRSTGRGTPTTVAATHTHTHAHTCRGPQTRQVEASGGTKDSGDTNPPSPRVSARANGHA